MSFIKLKDLDQFVVNKHNGFKWKLWDEANSKMLVSENWQEGYQKRHSLSIENPGAEDNTLELSQSQISQMLGGVMENGMANILGREFKVKTNGKTGMEIRYFINPVFDSGTNTPKTPINAPEEQNKPLTASDSANLQLGNEPAPEYQEEVKVENIPF